ncbi:MAG: NAD(P)-binding domain-containing protein [marine benthic group bacterium]|nr:NAD(P)-binding domain-containing protein [Candidatus Benthicola marisminoris]
MAEIRERLVLVAGELHDLSGPEPEWPGGRQTLFHPPGSPLPHRADVDAVIPLVSQTVGEDQLAGLPSLRVVANYGVGYDNIDLVAAERAGVVVTNTPDVLTDATADLAMALLLAAARRLREGLDLARSGHWEGWHPTQLLGIGLGGRVLGILGAGRIGTATARRAAAFGMEVVYWNRSRSAAIESEVGGRRAGSLADLLSIADVVSVHLPLTPSTRHLLDGPALASMKSGAILVNTARGSIVDSSALAGALASGHLAAAGLDVFENEPEIQAELRTLSNCVVLPHLGSATREARQAMWDLAAANVRALLSGESALTPVRAGRD